MKTNVSALEGLRGVAALLVVLFHARLFAPFLAFTAGGYLAVDLFFVLSGFVIASAYGHSLADGAALRVFMVRRFGRIWPTMAAAFVLCYVIVDAAAAMAHGRPALPGALDVFATITLTQGVGLFDHPIAPGVAWSASAEFYVYVLFGVLCLWMRGGRRIAAFAALAAFGYGITVWSSVAVFDCLEKGSCMIAAHDFGWARALTGFFGGVLVAEYRDAPVLRALRRPAAQAATFAVAAGLIAAAPAVPVLAFATPFAFAALISALAGDSGPVAGLLNGRAAQYLGSVSYPLYLAHGAFAPLFIGIGAAAHTAIGQAATLGAFLLLSFALAHVLRDRIERPYRERFRVLSLRFRGQRSASAAV